MKEKKRNDDKQKKKIWEKWTECRRRGSEGVDD
jgi:hypothetical protein